jgi:hypothetical protein
VSNTILAQGSATERIHEQIRVGDGWAVNLDASDPSDFYFQDLIVGPGGRTGWHSHPGLLMIAIKEGSIDFYDKDAVSGFTQPVSRSQKVLIHITRLILEQSTSSFWSPISSRKESLAE